jgi:hypothetical protein
MTVEFTDNRRSRSPPLKQVLDLRNCDRCGCSVDTDLIHPDSHHYAEDGDFLCSDCWGLGD